MSPAERALLSRIQRKTADLSPDMRRAYLRAIQRLRDDLSVTEVARIVEQRSVNRLLLEHFNDLALERAFMPVREVVHATVADAARAFAKDLPKTAAQVGFDILNPRVVTAIRTLDSRVMRSLKEGVRETVRQHVEAGLQAGDAPRTIARELRNELGLAPNQERAVENFRAMLERGDRQALTRALRDRRFDAAVRRGDLSPERIDRMAEAYRKRMVAFNAETHARTATLDSLKLGQHLSWRQGIDNGSIDPGRIQRTWVTVGDDRVRPEHQRMNGETVLGLETPFSNGQVVPGETDYNCRCIARISMARREAAA